LYSNLPLGEFSYPSYGYYGKKGVLLGLYVNGASFNAPSPNQAGRGGGGGGGGRGGGGAHAPAGGRGRAPGGGPAAAPSGGPRRAELPADLAAADVVALRRTRCTATWATSRYRPVSSTCSRRRAKCIRRSAPSSRARSLCGGRT